MRRARNPYVNAQLGEEFEGGVDSLLAHLEDAVGLLPRLGEGGLTELVAATSAEGVPPGARETKMVSHFLGSDEELGREHTLPMTTRSAS